MQFEMLMKERKQKYETPVIELHQITVENMLMVSFQQIQGKENLEPLKEVNDIEEHEWEGPISSSHRRDFSSWE